MKLLNHVYGLTILSSALFAAQSYAKDNWNSVKSDIEKKYHSVNWGPEFDQIQMQKALATKGASLLEYFGDVSDWLQQAGISVSKQAVADLVLNGKAIGNVAGGIAAINHWHTEEV